MPNHFHRVLATNPGQPVRRHEMGAGHLGKRGPSIV
jgi:hypothetical protein